MRITRLALKNWRNFRLVDCPLAPRTFIVGPNASGKSNLLDALRFLRDVASEGGGLQYATRKRDGFTSIRSLFTHGPGSHVEVGVDIEIDGAVWKYALHLEADGQNRGGAKVRYESVQRDRTSVLERPATREKRRELQRQTHLEQSSLNETFEPLVHGLRGIRYAHLVPQLLRSPRLIGDSELEPFGSMFLRRVFTTPLKRRKARLKAINEALRGVLPFFQKLNAHMDEVGNPHLEIGLKHWRPTHAYQNESSLSDGTLRLIGLLWEVMDGTSPLLLEEPELSLHESAVKRLPGLVARVAQQRQVILTTHAFSMFSTRGVDSQEILLVKPGLGRTASESVVESGRTNKQIRYAIQHEMSLGEELEAQTRPPDPDQLEFQLDGYQD